jgi:hypothetical protein
MVYKKPGINTKNLPRYSVRGDLVLIGVAHNADGKKSQKKERRFLGEISSTEHLILEGNLAATEIREQSGRTNYETLATQHFNGPIHHLEEKSRIIDVCTENGIRRELIGLYDLLYQIPNLLAEGYKGDVVSALKYREQMYPGWEELDLESTIRMLAETIGNFPDSPNLTAKVGSIFREQFNRLREHGVLIPKTLEYNATLDGKKVEIVGASHMNNLIKSLKGESVPPPEKWNVFVRRFDLQYQEAIAKIEEEIFPAA